MWLDVAHSLFSEEQINEENMCSIKYYLGSNWRLKSKTRSRSKEMKKILQNFETEFEAEICYCYDNFFIVISDVLKKLINFKNF